MQKLQHQCTITSLIKVSYLHGSLGNQWMSYAQTKKCGHNFYHNSRPSQLSNGLIFGGRNLPRGLSLPKNPAQQAAGAYPAWRNLWSGQRRGAVRPPPGLWPDVNTGPAPTSHLRDLGEGPNGATTKSEFIPTEQRGSFYRHFVNPCQPKLTQLPLAEGRATVTAHTTSGVIGW